jgi:hypothetical protein
MKWSFVLISDKIDPSLKDAVMIKPKITIAWPVRKIQAASDIGFTSTNETIDFGFLRIQEISGPG